jgi:imidazolonepropionase-like amidohydrolase
MKVFVLFLFSLIAVTAGAADIVVVGVKIHHGPGVATDSVAIRVSGDRIVAIGSGIDASGSTIYSGNDGYITPGFIDSGSTLGIEEVGLSTYAEDQKYEGADMGAAFNPALAYNHNSSIIPSMLLEGVTHVFLKPMPGKDVFAGQGSLLDLSGRFVSADSKAVYVYLGERGRNLAGKSRAAALQRLLLGLEEARLYNKKRKAYESNRLRPLSFPAKDLESLATVITREKKLAIYVDRSSEIESVLDALDSFDIDIVLVGAREAWKVADAISSRNIPVILNALDNRPASFDRLGARLDQPKLLHEAGVLFAYMTEDLFTESRMLSQAAGVAVAYGLPWQASLDALTVNPSRIWGVDDRLGRLEVGKEATLIIWDGDPLEVSSQATHMMIKGKFVELNDRQRMLRDRYRDLTEADKPFSYR